MHIALPVIHRALLLLSGGIDSPVAGYMMAKRGATIDALHFESFPYTSERAEEKVMELAKVLNENDIETRPIWKPLHMQPFFINGGCEFVKVAENAVCEDIFRHGICLPSDSKMTDAEQQKVIEVIKGQF